MGKINRYYIDVDMSDIMKRITKYHRTENIVCFLGGMIVGLLVGLAIVLVYM